MKRRCRFCISFALVFALALGLLLPTSNVYAAGKEKSKKVLVVYFSATGTTKSAAKKIEKATGGKLYQIKAAKRYTDADLDYSNDDCRANREQNNESSRPKVKGKIKNIRKYDVIFIGYPIWWGKEPMIIRTFLESYNLKGKKIVPFCTSGGTVYDNIGRPFGKGRAGSGRNIRRTYGRSMESRPYKPLAGGKLLWGLLYSDGA